MKSPRIKLDQKLVDEYFQTEELKQSHADSIEKMSSQLESLDKDKIKAEGLLESSEANMGVATLKFSAEGDKKAMIAYQKKHQDIERNLSALDAAIEQLRANLSVLNGQTFDISQEAECSKRGVFESAYKSMENDLIPADIIEKVNLYLSIKSEAGHGGGASFVAGLFESKHLTIGDLLDTDNLKKAA